MASSIPISHAYAMNALQIIKNYPAGPERNEALVMRRYMCECGRLLASGAECDRLPCAYNREKRS